MKINISLSFAGVFLMTMATTRMRRVSVALPGSLTKDIPHLREKTSRVGMIARTLAIFNVDRIILYQDEPSPGVDREAALFEKILRFQETPQYLRRHLFRMDPDLQFAGILPPLRIPSHPNRSEPRLGHVREALVVSSGNVSKVDAGYEQPVTIPMKLPANQRLTIRVTRNAPLEGERVDPSGLRIYWGFKVQREHATLAELLKRKNQDLTISTSRDGADIREVLEEFRSRWNQSNHPIILFGSPERGVPEILADNKTKVDEVADYDLNTIPGQGVETVRTEEALMASLAVFNGLGDKR